MHHNLEKVNAKIYFGIFGLLRKGEGSRGKKSNTQHEMD